MFVCVRVFVSTYVHIYIIYIYNVCIYVVFSSKNWQKLLLFALLTTLISSLLSSSISQGIAEGN